MKTALNLQFHQQLTLTPQLQQAIRLLQLSSLELEQEIQELLNSNMMLEPEEDQEQQAGESDDEEKLENQPIEPSMSENEKEDFRNEFESELYYFTGKIGDTEACNYDNFLQTTSSLKEHLSLQMRLTPMTEADRYIATAIIDAVRDDGFLSCPLSEIQESVSTHLPHIEMDEIAAVLRLVQSFEPAGVAARDVAECLMLQLHQLPKNTPWLAETKIVVSEYLGLLGQRNYRELQRKTKFTLDQLREIIKLIQTLNPHPGYLINPPQTEYVVPDLILRKIHSLWVVELNEKAYSHIRVNQKYAAMVQQARNSGNQQLLKTHLQEARWFLKSLQSRNETLLKVANFIVEYQAEFFEKGDEAMKPLVLHEIASHIGMHESTVSRITTKKYIHTPKGIFELKYFFSSHLETDEGGECSSIAIRALIKKLIEQENSLKPLSDSKIAAILSAQGIRVARRTIAKYREAMHIPSSHERKTI